MSARPPAAVAVAGPVRGNRLRIAESRDEALVGREFLLERPCLIGRADECDIALKDPNISRRHAQVSAGPTGVTLTDQKSANGTWVGDQRVTERRLAHMDRFRIGHTVFEVLLESAEAEEEDLDLARTSAVPVAELFQSLQLKAVSKLEDEGLEVLVSGNRPFFLDDPGSMWLVETGRLDVFTVTVKNGEAAGARSFFVGAEPGMAVFGMDLARYGQGSAFLAVGKTGTRLRKIPTKRLAELAKNPAHAERIAMLVEGWIVGLTHALVRDIPPDRVLPIDLVPGEPLGLDFQKRARARKGIVWVDAGPGNLTLIGLSEVRVEGEPVPFPVTEEAWVESSEDGLVLNAVPSATALTASGFWTGLDAFHEALCEAEFLNKRLATVDEFNRLKSKVAQAEHAREAAYAEIGGVLAGPAERPAVAEGADLGPVFAACALICGALGMEAKKPSVDLNVERTFEETLQLVATASRFRTRVVALRGSWWEHDHGPILARFEATKQPVALLPTGPSAYEYVDTATGQRARVDGAFGQTLHPFGHIFYRRFPDGVLTVKQVVAFGARGLKRDLRSLILMALGLGVLGSLTPYFTGRLFDTAIPQAQRGLLAQFCAALLLSAFTSAAFKLTQSIAVMRIQGRMDYSIQAALWDRLLDLPSTFFKTYSSGDLADRALGIDAIRQLVAGAGIGAILGSLSSLFYLVMMLGYSVPLALLGIALTLVFVTFTTSANLLQLRSQREQLTVRGQISGLVLQLISGVGKLRVSGAENHGFRVWATSFAQQRRLAFRAGNIQNAVQVFNSGFPIVSSICIFALLANVQKGGGGNLSTGEFIAFSAAYTLFLAAMQSLSDASLSLLKAVPIWERLTPILTAEPEVDESKAPPGTLRGEIEISHVSFRYAEDSPWILKDVSLKIRPGQFVAFVGGSGCGKSTLMRLMLGFERPAKGSILYDGQDLSTLDVRLVRQQLGVVLQDSRVLPVDIFRNIVGASSRTLDDAWQAAESASLADDIREMPMGMHTYVSEGGGGLSGGQKQRLMIARAIVNRPKVLFLDEATSALDNKAQAIVTESMDKMHSTRIVIAHRLSTIVNADTICFLQEGAIAEMGSYKELMEKDGLFAALAKRQIV